MKLSSFLKIALVQLTCFIPSTSGQKGGIYTEPKTGIQFWSTTIPNTSTTGGFQWGFAVPPAADNNELDYIGHVVGARQEGEGWSGISHGGGMPSSLLLLAWVDDDEIKTSFRYASGYVTPELYTGNATLTEISHAINETHFSLTYLCQSCWAWNQNGASGSQPPSNDVEILGWVQSSVSPVDQSDPDSAIVQHDNGMGMWGAPVASARNADYSSWAALATPTQPGGGGGGPTPTTCVGRNVPKAAYDYIVVGAGAAGIPLADRLSESGKSVLLIEKGPPSSGRWGGTMKPDWLKGTNLTRFDVPGLCNEIWADSDGIACTGIDQMAGCVLGGGTAINAALWWRAPDIDWDDNFPIGWKSKDMSSALSRVFGRVPGTYRPSADGKIYLPQGYKVVSSAMKKAGWREVVANSVPNEKDKVYSHTPYMFSHGERGGPMATYLVTAFSRPRFRLWMNTGVRRLVRQNGHVTGVEVEGTTADGYCGTVNVTATSGRVILSAGVFGSSKILFRSGIGPRDQLDVVKASSIDGSSMIASSKWIHLPVGRNLNDHVNTDLVIHHPDVVFYNFYDAYDSPISADRKKYLDNRVGILTQAAPNIGPVMWQVVHGSDGVARQLQWTSRVEGSLGDSGNHSMTISQYLGRGSTSRGVLSILPDLAMKVSKVPYLQTSGDLDAVVQGINTLRAALKNDPKITMVFPPNGMTTKEYVDNYVVSTASRRSNHWLGTAKMGTDNGLYKGGTSVVDTNTKVFGMDNLHVVDASIFPGMVTTNPSALIMAVAEKASERILSLAGN